MAPQDETKQIIFLAHQLADLVPELLKLSTRHFKASRILVNTDILNDYAEIGSAFATIASTGKTLSAAILANEYTALTSDFASDLSRFVQVLEQIRGSAELDGFAKREGGEGRALRPAVIEESFRVVRHARSMAASVRLFTGVLEFGKALACPDSVDEMVRRTATNSILAAGNALREVKFLLEPGRFGPWRPYLIMKRHGDVDKWLSSLLLPKELDEPKEVAADSDTSPPSSSASSEADTESIDIPVRNRVFFDRDNDFGSIPPPPPGSRLDQTPFIKVHKDYVDQRTLEYFNTDYAVKKVKLFLELSVCY
ncbi:hypothetical protein EJ06DRAFT_359646 [Trichodelitschia bisporula]|uniref:Uncharacterized protein n=1 Tax=Trichodelitschia bisporula TaxID=703511 RepID=A0A6G1I0F4_9PEZI|nr:hypothetical protein EJ06DRAFT_359646 [Trichodelitschia bisporula]